MTDPHGNVVQLTDESGAVTKTYEYDSFDNEVKPDGKDNNLFRYYGEYYDKEMEVIYLRARYYQPAVGRFLTRDTYTGEEDEPESLHLYTYCGNDGVNNVDPSGHDSYILFDKDGEAGMDGYMFKDEAKIVKKRLKKKYGKQVYLLAAKNAKHFKKMWNKKVGYKKNKNGKWANKKAKIDEVYIILHGGTDSYTGYGFFQTDHIYTERKKLQ